MNHGRDFLDKYNLEKCQARTWFLFLPQVFRLEDSCCLFTLQGHSGAITTVYIDQVRDPWSL